MLENRVKRVLQHGGAVLGTSLSEFRSPAVVVSLARSGMDFFVIDAEHSQYDLQTIEDLCIVAREVDLCPIVRIPEINRSYIGRILDAGALGLMVPRIESLSEVEAVVSAARFPPRGTRGFNLGLANTRFRWVDPTSEVMRAVDDEILIIVEIEEQEALRQHEAIASVDGVDVVFIGPFDLSISLGIPGETNHPKLREAVARVIAACGRAGIAAGIPSDESSFERLLKEGIRFLNYGGDLFFIQDACQRAMQSFRQITGPLTEGR